MKITKVGHCCLVLEEKGIVIITDPGSFTSAQNELTGIDVVLITHEHQDHFHLESLRTILKNNPHATVITNLAVGVHLAQEGIVHHVVGDQESTTVRGILIEGFGKDHAPIYGDMGKVENTSYLVAGRFYLPGDNFHVPGREIDVLALPVAGPWMRISDAIDFAKKINPRAAFGVHDGMLVESFRGFAGMLMHMFVKETEYVALADGESHEF